jgi:multidrug efflux system outer membrane protein
MMRKQSVLLAALVLAACGTIPPTHTPLPSGDFKNASLGNYSTEPAVQAFWRTFDDALLDELIHKAIAANLDLRVADARLRQSRAVERQSQFDLVPRITASADYVDSKSSSASLGGLSALVPSGLSLRSKTYGVSLDGSWEVDLFGRVRSNVRGRAADREAAFADLHAARVSVTSEVARVYFSLRGTNARLAVARESAASQQQSVDLTRVRKDVGAGSQLDVASAVGQLQTTIATIPLLDAQQQVYIYQLAVLLGESPSQFSDARLLEQKPTAVPALVSVGDATQWLRRRPDIRAAEARVASAAADVGVSVASLFPRVNLIGSIGRSARTPSGLHDSDSETWSWGPSISWAALDIPRLLYQVKYQRARRDESAALYEKAVLQALQETESSLVQYSRARERESALEAADAASREASDLARAKYEAGAADFLSVLVAERNQLQASDLLAQARTDTGTFLVAVYKALGVGWDANEAGQQLRR